MVARTAIYCQRGAFAGTQVTICEVADEIEYDMRGVTQNDMPDDYLYSSYCISDSQDGKYARLTVENCYIDIEKIMRRHPDAEAAIYQGWDKHCYFETFNTSDYGTESVLEENWAFMTEKEKDEGDYSGLNMKARLIRQPSFYDRSLKLTLKTGEEVELKPKKNFNTAKELKLLRTEPITMESFVRICCAHRKETKQQYFRKQLEKKIKSVSDIVELRFEEHLTESNDYDISGSAKKGLKDPSIAYMLETRLVSTVTETMDLVSNVGECVKKRELIVFNEESYKYDTKVLSTKVAFSGDIKGICAAE